MSAITLLRENDSIDLLFTDVVMPGGMTGRKVAEEGRRLRPAMKVSLTSGYTQEPTFHQGQLDPGVHLRSKPYRCAGLARQNREGADSNDRLHRGWDGRGTAGTRVVGDPAGRSL